VTYIKAVKDGFNMVHKNWQLLLIQLGMVVMSSVGFFIIVGIPLAVAFIIFGVDLTGFTSAKDILRTLREPSDILSRYLGLVIIVFASLLLYLVTVAMFGIYVFGGCIGVLGISLKNSFFKFSMHAFFVEAKRLFLRLLGFTCMIGIALIVAAFILGILGGSISAMVSFAQSQDSTLAIFLGTFFYLILILLSLVLILGILSVTLYGIASLSLKDTGPLKSITESIHYLAGHPSAFWLYAILFAGYVLSSFFLILLSYSFIMIPVVGTILSFPYQLISYIFQTYLGLAIIATVLTYYYSTEICHRPDAVIESPVLFNPVEEKTAKQDTDAKEF
jgi:hypothetical protein